MSHACCGPFGVVERRSSVAVAAARAGQVLSFAAAPVFALMALWAGVAGPPEMMCMSGQGASPLGGMATMYLLMSAFHLPPWLSLVTRRLG